jgi:uncharacterized protein with ATP-grasp and redox domains
MPSDSRDFAKYFELRHFQPMGMIPRFAEFFNMKAYPECAACFIRQAIEAGKMITCDKNVLSQIIAEAQKLVDDMDMTQTPPLTGMRLYRMIRNITGVNDPYYEYKRNTNRQLMDMIDRLRLEIQQAADPFMAAVLGAASGNMIDCGINGQVTDEQIRLAFHDIHEAELAGEIETFRREVERAENILYLADNSGEIVLDRLLIELLPMGKITLAVRGKPIINDVLMEDAVEVGLTDMVRVIDNGSDAPGTILSECSENFRQAFAAADLIISKGQGNFEALSDMTGKNIIFLLKAKCDVISRHIGLPLGTPLLRHIM